MSSFDWLKMLFEYGRRPTGLVRTSKHAASNNKNQKASKKARKQAKKSRRINRR